MNTLRINIFAMVACAFGVAFLELDSAAGETALVAGVMGLAMYAGAAMLILSSRLDREDREATGSPIPARKVALCRVGFPQENSTQENQGPRGVPPEQPEPHRPLKVLVTSLFLVLMVLQLGDFHSSLAAAATQHEANRVLVALGRKLGVPNALLLLKGIDIAATAVLFWVWRRSARLDREFTTCLLVVVGVYGTVVANNYLGG